MSVGLSERPKPGEVGRDAAKAGVAHRRDHLAPQKRPGRLAVHEDTGGALALVEVRQAQAVDLAVVRARTGSPADPRALLGRAHRVGHLAASIPGGPSVRLARDAATSSTSRPSSRPRRARCPFYIAGGLLVAWALIVSLGLGMRNPNFPAHTRRPARGDRDHGGARPGDRLDGRAHLRRLQRQGDAPRPVTQTGREAASGLGHAPR